MGEVLIKYEPVHPTTWVYLSSLLLIALYFKFSRMWSVRNLDLIGLMALSPGLLMVNYGHQNPDVGQGTEQAGYIWLFCIGGLFVIRLLLDSVMVRRPLLEPNLSVGGLSFLGVTLFVFLMTNVLVIPPELIDSPVETPPPVAAAGDKPAVAGERTTVAGSDFAKWGPGNPLVFRAFAHVWQHPPLTGEVKATTPEPTPKVEDHKPEEPLPPTEATPTESKPTKSAPPPFHTRVRVTAVATHFFIVLGLILIGYWHFDNIRTGIAAAVLYLLLPYTAQWTGQVTHFLPAALLVWAIVMYRRPLLSGILMGLVIGTAFYPIFLLPLWISFYAQRGWRRFVLGVLLGAAAQAGWLWIQSVDSKEFVERLKQTFGLMFPTMEHLEGFWGFQFIDPVYRVTVLAAFAAVACSLALWPSRKNLATLLSCSAVVLLGTQFWHAHRGGLYMAWDLPLMLLTIFRPNLEDRVALTVVGEGWFTRRKPAAPPVPPVEKAA